MRILVVDDDRVAGNIYRQALELEGYEVDLAGNGFEALQRIDTSRPDLVLLDLLMPVMDGWQVLARLRTRPDSPPVIAVSASSDYEQAVAAGAAAAFAKPCSLAELRDGCRRLLSRQDAGRYRDQQASTDS